LAFSYRGQLRTGSRLLRAGRPPRPKVCGRGGISLLPRLLIFQRPRTIERTAYVGQQRPTITLGNRHDIPPFALGLEHDVTAAAYIPDRRYDRNNTVLLAERPGYVKYHISNTNIPDSYRRHYRVGGPEPAPATIVTLGQQLNACILTNTTYHLRL
jgi:hypothetical protein